MSLTGKVTLDVWERLFKSSNTCPLRAVSFSWMKTLMCLCALMMANSFHCHDFKFHLSSHLGRTVSGSLSLRVCRAPGTVRHHEWHIRPPCSALHVKHNITHPPPGTWELHGSNQAAALWFTVWGGDLHNSQHHIPFSHSGVHETNSLSVSAAFSGFRLWEQQSWALVVVVVVVGGHSII